MKSIKVSYYNGGFAEIVSSPSDITYSYLKEWFNGKSSLGKAMKILGLPYQEINLPILELIEGELVVNLQNEERTIYANSLFKYGKQNNLDDTPKLIVDPFKLLNPLSWISTLSILIRQSIWISSPKKVVKFAKGFVENIPEVTEKDSANIDQILKDDIWPQLIALGFLSEFFNQLIKQDSSVDFSSIHSYVSGKQAVDDWFYLSISEQKKVKDKKLSFDNYIKEYGKRADKDYELSCPRWYEIKDIIKKRINELSGNFSIQHTDENFYHNLSKNLKSYIDALIDLQILRSEAKRKALLGIDILRKKIKQKIDLSSNLRKSVQTEVTNKLNIQSGSHGQAVSAGIVWGRVKHIIGNDQLIPEGCICIFPSASPEFSIQYPKCKGMIFLKGGQTSHGSIVAREFGIPALIESEANGLKDGVLISINGTEGSWIVGKSEDESGLKKPEPELNQYNQDSSYFDPHLGGKASALKKMFDEDLPVPEFFVINSEKFQKYAEGKLPEDFKMAVLNKFDSLNTDKVAVRSSALNEDSMSAAWAGQLESYLNVSKKDLIHAIQKCWDSIKTKRVKEYVNNKRILSSSEDKNIEGELSLAVIVQKMINSDCSGVIFTVDPVTKKTSEIVIEASLGLGENVAQGKITPNRFLLDKESFNIKDTYLQGKPVLEEKQVKDLAKLALEIEEIFRFPQDIEWAIKENKIYILQSRPITTL